MNYNLAQVFQCLAAELDRYLKDTARPTGYAGLAAPAQLLADAVFPDASAKNRVSIALLNVLSEGDSAHERHYQIMVFAAFAHYENALSRLSQAQDFFLKNAVLTAVSALDNFPAETVQRIDFQLETMPLDALRDIWQMHGGRALPAIFLHMKVTLA